MLAGCSAAKSGAPQRRCEHVTVFERHVPHRDAHRRGRRDNTTCAPPSRICEALAAKAQQYANLVKSAGPTSKDATPITLGQELSGYVAQLARRHAPELDAKFCRPCTSCPRGHRRRHRPQRPPGLRFEHRRRDRPLTKLPFVSAPNKFAALAPDASLPHQRGGPPLACSLMKIANDIRWLASGPRCGLSELSLPENEPGSSIMPGKVNPTQCEALTMVCVQSSARTAASPSPARRATSSSTPCAP